MEIDSELPAGAVYHLEVFKHQVRTRQDYSVNAAFDFDFRMKWCHWQHEKQLRKYRGGAEEITVIGVAGLGRSHCRAWIPTTRLSRGISLRTVFATGWPGSWTLKNRWIDFSGTRERVFENNVDYKLTELHEDAIPPGIEVVDMSQEENQVKYGE